MDGLLNSIAKDIALFKSPNGYWLSYFPEEWDIGKAIDLSKRRLSSETDLFLIEFLRIIPCTEKVRIPENEIVGTINL